MACLSKLSYTKKVRLNRSRFVYKRCISLTKMASGVQNWRFVYKYAVFNLQTSISPYKLAPRITTQLLTFLRNYNLIDDFMGVVLNDEKIKLNFKKLKSDDDI